MSGIRTPSGTATGGMADGDMTDGGAAGGGPTGGDTANGDAALDTAASLRAPALRIDRLSVALGRGTRGPRTRVIDDLDLTVERGEFCALVGESGSGKTIAALSVTRQLPPNSETWGRISVGGESVLELDARALRRIRGGAVGMVFQNPLSALNPSHRVGAQITEAIRLHSDMTGAAARARALALLDEVGIPNARTRIEDHPHQFSGGQRQRVMIAIALAAAPRLLIADEPTTGLDPLVARQILALLARLRRQHDMGVLFVTHDLSIVREAADSVHVLYAGRTVEKGRAGPFFAQPRHPYSAALLTAAPVLGRGHLTDIPGQMPEPDRRPPGCRFAPRCFRRQDVCERAYPPLEPVGGTLAACLFPLEAPPDVILPDTGKAPVVRRTGTLLSLSGVSVRYGTDRNAPFSLRDVTLGLSRGECLGIVGESGSGKSTLGRAILQMVAYEGAISLDGENLASLRGGRLREARRRIQVVFQDPRESLNPRLTIGDIVTEPLRLAGKPRRGQAERLLDRVGLPASLAGRLPNAVSGGQAQRVAIARALAVEPDVIVLDEPTSSLDVSTQATLLNLLAELGRSNGISYVLISHDIAAVAFLADRIAVLRNGAIVELQGTGDIIARPRDAYTAALIETARPKEAA